MIINKYGNYLRETFGRPIYRITVDAGFTCPNRDGTKGFGGCTYCNNEKFFQQDLSKGKSVREQVIRRIERRQGKNRELERYIIYFQTYSNTYAEVSYLRELYNSVLDVEGVIGMAIGTRADCVNEEVFELLQELSQKYYVCVEYGLESISDETLLKINRGHDLDCFVKAVKDSHRYGLDVCAHLIFGFPWEEREIAKRSAEFINELPIKFVKLHQLQIVKNSIMGSQYLKSPFELLDRPTYMNYLIDFISHLDSKTVVQRVAGDCSTDMLLASGFSDSSHKIMFELEKKLSELQQPQGIFYRGKHELSQFL